MYEEIRKKAGQMLQRQVESQQLLLYPADRLVVIGILSATLGEN